MNITLVHSLNNVAPSNSARIMAPPSVDGLLRLALSRFEMLDPAKPALDGETSCSCVLVRQYATKAPPRNLACSFPVGPVKSRLFPSAGDRARRIAYARCPAILGVRIEQSYGGFYGESGFSPLDHRGGDLGVRTVRSSRCGAIPAAVRSPMGSNKPSPERTLTNGWRARAEQQTGCTSRCCLGITGRWPPSPVLFTYSAVGSNSMGVASEERSDEPYTTSAPSR